MESQFGLTRVKTCSVRSGWNQLPLPGTLGQRVSHRRDPVDGVIHGHRSSSSAQLLRINPKTVLGVEFHVGHRLELRFVKGRKLGFGRAELLEMFAGVGEAVVRMKNFGRMKSRRDDR